MPLLKPVPGPGITRETVEIVAGETLYAFTPGEETWVAQEHVAAVTAALKTEWGSAVTPAAPTVANQGAAGATSYTYAVALVTENGDTQESGTTVWATGNANLANPNGTIITPAPADLSRAGVMGWRVIRTAGGPSQGDVSGVLPTSQASFTDNGGAAAAYTPAGANPGLTGVWRAPEQG